MTPADISVVIPAINEAAVIKTSVRSAVAAGAGEGIVVDGGSSDPTCQIATDAGASQIVCSPAGRGIQLNAGARQTQGKYLLFLHADNQLGEHCLSQICEYPDALWGAFRQSIDSQRKIFRIIEWGNALRARRRGMPFGDQATFVRRDLFFEQGGFPEIALMEDVELSRRLRQCGRPLLLDGPLTISARRWLKNGVIRQTLRNWSLQFCYTLGASPETLRRWYK
jgi:rSAM/selenodomain-associated transferase 2